MGTINLNLNSSLASSIQSTANLISSVVNGFVVSPNDAPLGVSGFVFNIIDDEEMVVDSDVTDHFVEQNYSIQDHIALKPIRFTLKGFQGELNYVLNSDDSSSLNVASVLSALSDISPVFNAQDGQVYSSIAEETAQAADVISNVQSLSSLISDLSTVQTNQQTAFNFFLNMRNNRQLVTIQTPYGLLTNYVVENFRSMQPGDSRFMSRFTVTFKEIKVVSTSTAPTTQSPNTAGSGTQTSTDTTQADTTSTGTTVPAQSQVTSTNVSMVSDATSGRLTDMTATTVDAGQTAGVTAVPDTTPTEAVNVDNIFPTTSPVFQTLALQPVTPML
jgi:hypothetical protein